MLGITLRDVVQGQMKFALVSNMMVDLAWLLSACPDLHTAEEVLIVHNENDSCAIPLAEALICVYRLAAKTF